MRITLKRAESNRWLGWASLWLILLLIALAGRSGWGQTNLGLTASVANNALQLTITNGFAGATYDLFSVPVLPATGAVPWTLVQTGAPGQTVFNVLMTPSWSG